MKPLKMPDSVNYHLDTLRRFNNDVAEHEMTVLHDDGLYRHLQFRKPGTSMYWFDLHTAPGILTVRGDMGTYVFARTEDMFDFFSHDVYVNAGYWGEKLQSISTRGYRELDEDKFTRFVLEDFWERRTEYEPEVAREIWETLRSDVLGDYVDRSTEAAAWGLLHEFRAGTADAFRYDDPWGNDFTEYTYPYLWCCHAILAGIRDYREAGQA